MGEQVSGPFLWEPMLRSMRYLVSVMASLTAGSFVFSGKIHAVPPAHCPPGIRSLSCHTL